MVETPRKLKRDPETKVYEGFGIQLALFMYSSIRILFDSFIDFILGLLFADPSKLPPLLNYDFLDKSAVELAEMIRNRQLSSETCVTAFTERATQVGQLNAIVHNRYAAAIKEASAVDKFLADTAMSKEELKREKPFLGVPFTSKESTAAKDMSFSFGMLSRKNVRATEDAEIIKRMKESGAILIGVTNVPELNLWYESRNNVYGQTRNPHDFNRTPGGSSGGEGAIVSACGSPFGLGTDIGGSLRTPAYFCGLFGHKPSAGLIPTKGMTFRSGNEGNTIVTSGTITRYAKDIIPFLNVLLGEKSGMLKLDTNVNLSDIKFVYTLDPGDMRISPVSNEVISTILKVVDHLSTVSKHHIEKVNLNGFKFSYSLWRHAMSKEPSNFAVDITNRQGEASAWAELLKVFIGQCKHTLPCILKLLDMQVLPPTNKIWAEKELKELSDNLHDILGSNGVLIFPSFPSVAPYHYAPFFRPFSAAYWSIFNAINFPVTQVPIGVSKSGLPLGLQVVSTPYNDHLCIAVAKELEQVFGGWIPPFSHK